VIACAASSAIHTRRPLYLADAAALCVRVRETSVGWNGRFVLFYERAAPVAAPKPEPPRNGRKVPPAPAPDPLAREMVETLRAMGVRDGEAEIFAAVSRRCPGGVSEDTFEADLRAVFDALRCRDQG
jgi:hypothetical protein